MSNNKIANIVATVELNTIKATEQAHNFSQQLKSLSTGIRDLTKVEKEFGKSEETFKARAKLLEKEGEVLKNRRDQAKKEFDEFVKQNKDKENYTHAQIVAYNKLNRAQQDAEGKYNTNVSKRQATEQSFTNFKQAQIDKIARAEEEAINKQRKLEEDLKKQRKKNLDDLLNTAEKGSEAIMVGITAASAAAGVSMNAYMEHEADMLDVTRVARGSDEQNKVLEEQLDEFIWSRPEENAELLSAAEVIIKAVDPANYKDVNTYLEDIANASMASNKALDEIAKESMGLVEKGVLTIDELDNYYSAMNETQNRFGTDMGMQSEILNTVGAQAVQNNISVPDMIALAGYVSKVTSRGAEASSSSLVELSNLFGSASYQSGGAEQLLGYYGGDWDVLYQAQLNNTDEYKAVVESTRLKTEDLNKQLDTLAFRSDVAQYTGRTTNEVENMVKSGETGTLFAEFFEGMRAQADREGILLAELTKSKGYFKNNTRLQEMIAALSSAGEGVLAEYLQVANEAFTEGTSVDDEAGAILDLTINRFKVWTGKIKQLTVEIGEGIAPGIMAFLEEDVTPFIEKTLEFAKKFGEMDLDEQRDKIQSVVRWVAGIFLAAGGIRTVVGSIRAIETIGRGAKGLSNLTGLSTLFSKKSVDGVGEMVKTAGALKTGTEGLAGTGGAAIGTLGKLKVGIAGLASPIGLVVGSLGLLAGALYLQHQRQERLAEEAVYNQSSGTLSEGQKAIINDDVSGTRAGRAKTGINVTYDLDVEYTTEELNSLEKGVKNQVETIKEQLDKTASDFKFTLTGDAELDAKMSTRAEEERVNAALKKKEADELQLQLLGIYAEAMENGGQLTQKQIEEVKRLQQEIDVMYAKYTGGDEEGAQGVYSALQNQQDYSLLSNKEAEALSTELSEAVTQELINLRGKQGVTAGMLASGDITKEQADLQNEKDIEYFNTTRTRLMAEAASIRTSRNTWDKLFYDDAFLKNEDYDDYTRKSSSELGKGMGDLSRMERIGVELISDAEDRAQAQVWLDLINEIKGDPDLLKDFADNGVSTLFNKVELEEGTEALINLQAVLGGLLPEDATAEMAAYIQLLVYAKNEAGTLTDEEFRLYVDNNFSEVLTEAIEVGDLWENTDFRDKFLALDLNTYDATDKIAGLLREYDSVPEELVTNVWTSGTDIAKHNIDKVNQELIGLPHEKIIDIITNRTTYINTVVGNSQVSTGTIMNEAARKLMGYKNGTDSHPGGLSWLGDGGQSEPYLTPDGSFGISPADWTLYDLPKATKVWPSVGDFFKDLPKFALGTDNSWLDSTLKGTNNINGTTEGNVTYNIEIGENAGVSKGEVERIIRKVNDENNRRNRSIKLQTGVI